ncbi:MAG: M48 family metalloprotease [Hyphomicrobiaceae bacterium]
MLKRHMDHMLGFSNGAPRALAPSRRTGHLAVSALVAASVLASSVTASAQGIPLIRDSEIESVLSDYAKPLFKVAGLGSNKIQMRIVNENSFNAFVVDGRSVFVNTGTLMQSDTPNQVIGVIAHETGHITGGHMAALRARIAKDQTRALLMQILGIGLMVAGGAGGNKELGGAGQGVMFGGGEMIQRGLLAERRQQESAADQAGLKLLEGSKQSGRGMLETFERFAQQEYISDAHQDAFVRSHPVATDRLARLRKLVEGSPFYNTKDDPALQLRHDLMRAKLSGYLEGPSVINRRYPASNTTLPARYARALAKFFKGGEGALQSALTDMDGLIRDQPNNPWFYEVKGDILTRAGRKAESIAPLRQALKLAGDSMLIRVQLADSLMASGDPTSTNEAVDMLRKSLIDDQNPRAYRLLATAYYKQGKGPEADAAQAQAEFQEGDLKKAQIFAKRAQTKLAPGSPDWIKTDDIINYKPQT